MMHGLANFKSKINKARNFLKIRETEKCNVSTKLYTDCFIQQSWYSVTDTL